MTKPRAKAVEAPVYRYVHVSEQATDYMALSGELVAVQGRANAILELGDEIELPEPVIVATLAPADEATELATAELAAWVEALEAQDEDVKAAGNLVVVVIDDEDAPDDDELDDDVEAHAQAPDGDPAAPGATQGPETGHHDDAGATTGEEA